MTYDVVMDRQLRLAEPRQRLAEPRHDAVVARHRAVPWLAGDPRAHPAEALLGDLHRIERRVAEVKREPADSPIAYSASTSRAVLLDEEPRAEIAARLLVGDRREDDVAVELAPACAASRRRIAVHIAAMFFMSIAPRPHRQPSNSSPENGGRRHFGRVRLDDVEVRRQQQRRQRAGAAMAHDEVRAVRLAPRAARARARPRAASRATSSARGSLVAGRIRRVDAQQRLTQSLRIVREARQRHRPTVLAEIAERGSAERGRGI